MSAEYSLLDGGRQPAVDPDQRRMQHAANLVGGVDRLNEIICWAGRNLTPEEIPEYNRRLACEKDNVWQAALLEIARRSGMTDSLQDTII